MIARVADGDVVADVGRVRVALRMHDRRVLHVGPVADADRVDVAPHDDIHPQAALAPDFHVADDLRAVVHERGGVHDRHVGRERPEASDRL